MSGYDASLRESDLSQISEWPKKISFRVRHVLYPASRDRRIRLWRKIRAIIRVRHVLYPASRDGRIPTSRDNPWTIKKSLQSLRPLRRREKSFERKSCSYLEISNEIETI